ncbi:MAG: anthranilate/aminodeoxychorismate synthase component II [Deltaproteobacteria bacterium]|nr:MAG: anthranilate/aminodeoxychorismate synthase component II [Deltaproteobacteria bacterium]
MLLMIDNYDSFTYNIVQYLGILGAEVRVYRNDKISVAEVEALKPSGVVISPGPGDPTDAGVSVDVIKTLAGRVPILGVCLGHQSMAYAFGSEIIRAKRIMHGKVSKVHHDGKTIYEGIDNPFDATRYHSLVVKKGTLHERFRVNSWTVEDDEIMGIADDEARLYGIQYHPESILTGSGMDILKNFLKITE